MVKVSQGQSVRARRGGRPKVKKTKGARRIVPPTLADAIEAYLLQLIEAAERSRLEISRRQLAQRFRCAPSQINYVLETRFTPERGFVVRSRRGGGGCILIAAVAFEGEAAELLREAYRQAGRGLAPTQAANLVKLLYAQEIVDEREARLMEAALTSFSVTGPGDADSVLRGRMMRAMLRVLMS